MHLPHISQTQEFRPAKEGDPILSRSIWSYRHTVLGAVGIFLYVGVEVGLASIAVNYFKTQGVDSAKTASFLVSLYWGGALVGRLLGSWILTKIKSGKLLGSFGFAAALFVLISMFTTGQVAIWAIVLCGFFNSIMFPNIFALGITGPGTDDEQGIGTDYDGGCGRRDCSACTGRGGRQVRHPARVRDSADLLSLHRLLRAVGIQAYADSDSVGGLGQ